MLAVYQLPDGSYVLRFEDFEVTNGPDLHVYLAAGMAVVVIGRLVWDPVIIGDELGRTPILNWLLYGYGVPALAFISAAWLFRTQKDDRAVQVLENDGVRLTERFQSRGSNLSQAADREPGTRERMPPHK